MSQLTFPPAELIARHAVAGPRYTSYPTAAEFSERYAANNWKLDLENYFSTEANPRLALYVHVPFCAELCYYCACNKVIAKNKDVTTAYLRALEQEVRLYREVLGPQTRAVELHLGGGTPNFLPAADLARLYEIVSILDLDSQADISLEVDPRTLERAQLELLRTLGFNRLSLGVQDFDPHVQETINRRQSVEQTRDTIEWARALGFKSINVDLIYGLPEQHLAGFERTLSEVNRLRPERISLFGYAHVTWVSKTQKTFARARVPGPKERLELFQLAVQHLSAAGYEHIGLDHFALPHDDLCQARNQRTLSRNFMGYTSCPSNVLLGFGPSAISSLPTAFAQNEKDLLRYYAALDAGSFPVQRGVHRTTDDQRRGAVIEELLCFGNVNLSTLGQRFACDLRRELAAELSALEAFERDALLEQSADGFQVTALGQFFLRNIAMVFDAHLSKHQSGTKPVFSQTV